MHSTVINRQTLLEASPIKHMVREKISEPNSGLSYGLTETGYDIRIAETIRFLPRPSSEGAPTVHIDFTDDRDSQNSEGRFILASTVEEFDMPADMVGYVKDKSSWARQGVSVFNTAINPGQRGFITLELVFNGEKELIIPAGTPIAQVHFMYLTHPAAYQGAYQDQPSGPQPSKFRD